MCLRIVLALVVEVGVEFGEFGVSVVVVSPTFVVKDEDEFREVNVIGFPIPEGTAVCVLDRTCTEFVGDREVLPKSCFRCVTEFFLNSPRFNRKRKVHNEYVFES